MKVKIEFEVNAPTSKVLKCLYDRLDILRNDLINIDDNFKDFSIEISIGDNVNGIDAILSGCGSGGLGGIGGSNTSDKYIHFNFHNGDRSVGQSYNDSIVRKFEPDREECPLYNLGTCWGTKEKERCFCNGLKKYCTFFDGFRHNTKGK